jgi:acetyl/propionyl-CoA carboxylase alpha subunit
VTRQLRRHYATGSGPTARVHDLDVTQADGRVRVHVDGRETTGEARTVERLQFCADLDVTNEGGRSRAVVMRDGDTVHVALRGRVFRLRVVAPRQDAEAPEEASIDPFVASPMTGVVRQVAANAGSSYGLGETLVVVEAMKMEFAVVAPRAVVVAEVKVKTGDRVEIGQVLVTFATAAAT